MVVPGSSPLVGGAAMFFILFSFVKVSRWFILIIVLGCSLFRLRPSLLLVTDLGLMLADVAVRFFRLFTFVWVGRCFNLVVILKYHFFQVQS